MKTVKASRGIILAVVTLFGSQTAWGQTEDTQGFDVFIPTLLSITAPEQETIDTSLPENQIDGEISFLDATPWTVINNNIAGATVTFVVQGPFTNDAGGDPIDATLRIFAITSNPNNVWSRQLPIAATTDGAGTTATVSARSAGPGPASFDIDVVFNNPGRHADLVSGSYTTTVVGTITGHSP